MEAGAPIANPALEYPTLPVSVPKNVSAASCVGRFPGDASVFAGFESTSVMISPLLIEDACDDVKFNRPFRFAVGPPFATPYCSTVAPGIALLPTEFPARHDTHSPPFGLLQRCANV